MLQVVFIAAPESPELVAALELLVGAKGKPLKVCLLERDADLTSVQTFQAALRGLGSRAALKDCLLVVNAAERARATQHTKLLGVVLVEDVAELPLLVAARIGSDSDANLEHALRWYLHARDALELSAIVSSTPERIAFRAIAWRPVAGDELGDVSGIHTPFALEGVVTRSADGGVESMKISEPSDDDVKESRNFVASLLHHGQLQTSTQAQAAGITHQIKTDAQGQRRLVRLRAGSR